MIRNLSECAFQRTAPDESGIAKRVTIVDWVPVPEPVRIHPPREPQRVFLRELPRLGITGNIAPVPPWSEADNCAGLLKLSASRGPQRFVFSHDVFSREPGGSIPFSSGTIHVGELRVTRMRQVVGPTVTRCHGPEPQASFEHRARNY